MTTTLFGAMDIDTFLRDYWQQKPLLIRQALPGYQCPISPEELAGLALEGEVVSRLIRETGTDTPWQVEHGPFNEELFLSLPEDHWTLLVQEVDRHVPEIAALLRQFSFLPRWRIDDIMISYAVDQGSVGPHVDQYDVFLLQGQGQRRWQLDQGTRDHHLIEGLELAILEEFHATDDWLLEPGDMLYLPAGVPHHGIAKGPCMTLSIGCRAPHALELLEGVLEQALLEVDYPRQRYRDRGVNMDDHPARLEPDCREELRQLVLDPLEDPAFLDRLIARHLSQASRVQMHLYPEDDMDEAAFRFHWQSHALIPQNHVRAFYLVDMDVTAFIDGLEFHLPRHCEPAITALLDQGLLPASEAWLSDQALFSFAYDAYQSGLLDFSDD